MVLSHRNLCILLPPIFLLNNVMKISILSSGRPPYDDRLYYHMAVTLRNAGHTVFVISGQSEYATSTEDILICGFEGSRLSKKEKINQFVQILQQQHPDVIICTEPLSVVAAAKYKRKALKRPGIIYDVTEWYPSKKYLYNYKSILRWLHFMRMALINIYAGWLSSAYIFGEHYKSIPFRMLFPLKKYCTISYYPDHEYISTIFVSPPRDKICLFYSGKISVEKGFLNLLKALTAFCHIKPNIVVELTVIGWYENTSDKDECEYCLEQLPQQVQVKFSQILPFRNYLDAISRSHIFIDLREQDFENDHCLPIRLFYAMAFGRPAIYSNLRAISREVDISAFGHLVDPQQNARIAEIVAGYVNNPEQYNAHCRNARLASEEKYNWGLIKDIFTDFVEKQAAGGLKSGL